MVISDPEKDPSQIVLVNFTKWQNNHDKTCVVQPGEHPYVAVRSIVYYPAPLVKTLKNLQQSEAYGLLKYHTDLSPELLKKIQLGAIKSPFLPLKARAVLVSQFPDLAEEAGMPPCLP